MEEIKRLKNIYKYQFNLIEPTYLELTEKINYTRAMTPHVTYVDMNGNNIPMQEVSKYYKLSKVFKKYFLKTIFNNILLVKRMKNIYKCQFNLIEPTYLEPTYLELTGKINYARAMTPHVTCVDMNGNNIPIRLVSKYYKLSKVFKKYFLKIIFNNILLGIYKEVKYRPGNSGYQEAKQEFDKTIRL